jgi:small-conductance mechanosensitive channel
LRTARHAARLLLGCALVSGSLLAQPAPSQPAPQTPSLLTAIGAEASGETFTLVFFNRPIVVLRARVLGRRPVERARSAVRVLDDIVAAESAPRVESREVDGASLLHVGDRAIIALVPADVDALAGETLESVTAEAVRRLQQALDETVEARTPRALLTAAILAIVALAVGIVLIWGLGRTRRIAQTRLSAIAERTLARSGIADIEAVRSSRVLDIQRWLVTGATVALQIIIVYGLLTFDLRLFPYTRPWGESLRSGLLSTAASAGGAILSELPNLATVLVILLLTRFMVRLTTLAFRAVEEGRLTLPGVYPETTQPTRRIVVAVLWLLAVVLSYKYVPGSDSEVFKGVSVFVGLIVSLGSTGVMNQLMSGLMLTYSRALRVGDFVKVAEVEGTVTHLGTLSTKIKTNRNEDVTIPNAIVISHAATNYSRHADDGVFAPTSITIGYDAPWRQVQALLLLAAERTPGVRPSPKPTVLQTALCDFYVQYTLLVCLDQPNRRLATLDALHANIQDAFNEYGVQIMSPNYEADPGAPKVVPPSRWYSAPAAPAEGAGVQGTARRKIVDAVKDGV